MLYSQGVALESLGVPRKDGGGEEKDSRKIWRLFAEHWHLFRGTPTHMWFSHVFHEVFGIREKLNAASADRIYDRIADSLTQPGFLPRSLYERFNRLWTRCGTTGNCATQDGKAASFQRIARIR
jgi:glucuronate isomerase